MASIKLNPAFIKDSLSVFKQRGLKGLLLGTTTTVSGKHQTLLNDLGHNFKVYQKDGARKGQLTKIDSIHKGTGEVYLIVDPSDKRQSLILFNEKTKITNGPDLWIYLSDSDDPKKSLGEYLNLGLIKGNKGSQIYSIDKSIKDLTKYSTVIIYCKQFSVLFSYATLR